MMRRVAGALATVVAAFACAGPVRAAPPAALAGVPSPPPAGAAAAWVTQSAGPARLARQRNLAFGHRAAGTVDIAVDPATRYQAMVGFGAALTDSSAFLLQQRMRPAQRRALLHELFSPDGGIGLSFLRLTIGASDFSRHHYTYDDLPAGQADPELGHFSIAPAQRAVLPLVRQALALNPDLKVMASPWSAPAWMKTSGSLIRGRLSEDRFAAYAEYLSRYVTAVEAAGVPVFAITVQNEPHFEPRNYPGMRLATDARRRFIAGYVGPLFAERHPDTQILEWDHNWDEPQAPLGVLADPEARRYVAGVAWHCYRGHPPAQAVVHDAYPDKDAYLTECSGGGWEHPGYDPLTGLAGGLFVASIRAWARGVLLWNLALDEHDGPHAGGCPNCRGVVTVDEATGAVTRNPEYWVLAHFSRFVRPGAVRIASGAGGQGLDDVAFQNGDGSIVLVVVNPATTQRRFTAGSGDCRFAATLPARSVATYVWAAAGTC